MNATDLRSKTEKELLKELGSTLEDVEKNVTNLLKGKSKDTSKIKIMRRDVARIKTVLAEKKILTQMKPVKEPKEEKNE